GSQFTLPAVASRATEYDLTPARRHVFEKWVGLYKEKMLSEGQYEGQLYDFFAPTFTGKVELRGLQDRDYKITDYEHNKVLGTVHGPIARVEATFQQHLMLE